MNSMRYVGLDVHAESISIAVADEGQAGTTWIGKFTYDEGRILKALRKLGKPETLRVAYEAGPTGYGLYRTLMKAGIECHVVAPTLIPVKAGDRVKTDRRDAEKLARCLRSGDLTDAWVPTEETEAMRDLVRAREAATRDQLRARQRVSKFLLRHGVRRPADMKKRWTIRHMAWLRQQKFSNEAQQAAFDDYVSEVEHADARLVGLEQRIDSLVPSLPEHTQAVIAALQSMRGVAQLTALTLVMEVERFGRFERPSQLMSYVGVVPSEDSSGDRNRRGHITKAGNAHIRRVLVESAWHARHKPAISYNLKRRQSSDPRVREIAWKAQHRLHERYKRLKGRGVAHNKVLIVIAREMLGFIWDIGNTVEHSEMLRSRQPKAA